MLISEICMDESGELVRVDAKVSYEDNDRPTFQLFVETDAAFRLLFWPDPNALLLAGLLPAWRAKEQRIYVDGVLCPMLVRDIFAALRVLHYWYPELGPPPSIEAFDFRVNKPSQGSAVSLLSCGVDSLATLRQNKLVLPADHPLSISAAIPVIFAEVPGTGAKQYDSSRLRPARNAASDLGVDLAPLWTNLWWLVDDGYFFDQKWHGALWASLAHLFSKGYSTAYIGASFDGKYLMKAWGSSPLLDPYYSSAHLRIQHHGSGMSRLEKTSLVADWPEGLNNLRVCQRDSSGYTNCGTCEKCIRVMTTLVALDKLATCEAFPVRDMSPDLLSSIRKWDMINNRYVLNWYRELIPSLSACGRNDLVDVIKDFICYFETKEGVD